MIAFYRHGLPLLFVRTRSRPLPIVQQVVRRVKVALVFEDRPCLACRRSIVVPVGELGVELFDRQNWRVRLVVVGLRAFRNLVQALDLLIIGVAVRDVPMGRVPFIEQRGEITQVIRHFAQLVRGHFVDQLVVLLASLLALLESRPPIQRLPYVHIVTLRLGHRGDLGRRRVIVARFDIEMPPNR